MNQSTPDSDSDCEMVATFQKRAPRMPRGRPKPSPPNWTQTAAKFKPKPRRGNGDNMWEGDVVASASFYGGSTVVQVTRGDLPRLADGMWLISSLVDFHCHEVANTFVERPNGKYTDLCVLPSTCWYGCSSSNGKYIEPPKSNVWESPLQHKYVAFPLNARNSHWLLGILVHASDLLVEVNPQGPVRASLLILNSIHGLNPPDLQALLTNFIKLLSMGKALRRDGLSSLKIFKPQVLQQDNGTDCGVYPGLFLSVFLDDPVKMEAICKGEAEAGEGVNELWHSNRVQQLRSDLKALVQSAGIMRQASSLYHSGKTPADLGFDY